MGKTYATTHFDRFRLRDSDSSEFHYLEGLGGHTPNPDWPGNYLDHIGEMVGSDLDVLFVSTHIDVRRGLFERKIPYALVIPHRTQKAEFLSRYRERGSSESFVATMDKMWDEWTDYSFESNSQGSWTLFNDGHITPEFIERMITAKIR
jgi:hypothetical protein